MKLISEEEIKLLDDLWKFSKYIKKRDRSYHTLLINSQLIQPIIKKLILWAEEQIGKKILFHDDFLISHRFLKNDFFSKHSDNSYVLGKNRSHAVGFHLDGHYSGGEYVLYNDFEIIDNTPGVPYIFDSRRPHEVKPITNGIRKSVIIFLNYEDIDGYNSSKII